MAQTSEISTRRAPWVNCFWSDSLHDADPEVAAIIGRELRRQRDGIELIASENIALSLIHI